MTNFEKVYDAFLSKILDDEWDGWTKEEVFADCEQLLESAISHFKFPRISLERADGEFKQNLTSAEIQILANYMKQEWLNRQVLDWQEIGPMYAEADFSPANKLDKLNQRLQSEVLMARKLESDYYRSVDGKPFKYRNLAGNPDGRY